MKLDFYCTKWGFEDEPMEAFIQRVKADVRPECIHAHTGKDWYSHRQNQAFIDAAQTVMEETGAPVNHETHRGRFSFCASSTYRFIRDNPSIRLTADFSHWCGVSESLLEDQQHLIDAAIAHTEHVHLRIGHAQGPQVNDPRAPEWQDVVARHMGW